MANFLAFPPNGGGCWMEDGEGVASSYQPATLALAVLDFDLRPGITGNELEREGDLAAVEHLAGFHVGPACHLQLAGLLSVEFEGPRLPIYQQQFAHAKPRIRSGYWRQ